VWHSQKQVVLVVPKSCADTFHFALNNQTDPDRDIAGLLFNDYFKLAAENNTNAAAGLPDYQKRHLDELDP
jgi:hypothetical protein